MTWEAEFARAPMPKKLAMLYLANDILQNSRKKGPEFVYEYHRALPRALQHMLKHGDDKVLLQARRMQAPWLGMLRALMHMHPFAVLRWLSRKM